MSASTTIYVTKYALSQGIFAIQAKSVEGWKYAEQVEYDKSVYMRFFLPRNDFAFTREKALEKAEVMRIKRIKSLKKSLKAMEEFKVKFMEDKE
jgi:hypothetical protein